MSGFTSFKSVSVLNEQLEAEEWQLADQLMGV